MIQSYYSSARAIAAVPHIEPKIGRQKSLPIKFRVNSADIDIFTHIVDENEYRLPDILGSNDTIIDIGAHIGCFTYTCLKRGAKKIYSYEAFKDNYDIAMSNFSNEIKTNNVKLYNLAVWRSDINQDILYCTSGSDPTNTGQISVTYEKTGEIQVNSIQLDKIIDKITNYVNRIKLLKLDCEGSEFPILFTSKKLSLIDYICGEYHPITLRYYDNINGKVHFDGIDLVYFLDNQGFSTITTNSSNSIGLFFAKRKGYDDFFKNTMIP